MLYWFSYLFFEFECLYAAPPFSCFYVSLPRFFMVLWFTKKEKSRIEGEKRGMNEQQMFLF
eukprot:gene4718-3409_t